MSKASGEVLNGAGLKRSFQRDLLDWQKRHGRHHLPWQGTRDPYRVWLSEIMLQQTQVVTVIDYYGRFLQRFPDVRSLAAAPADDVLGLWSGLGYYSRARNLHRCAQVVVALHGGHFPATAAVLQTLPGIGPSTAAAIAAFCFDERVAILDGNVKRVLSRWLGYGDDLASAAVVRALWGHATALLPPPSAAADMPRYTQALMDLGATVCLPRQPLCTVCPVNTACRAFAQGTPEAYPVKTRKLKRSSVSLWLLWAKRADGAVWLAQRPATGIWASLFCMPMFESEGALLAALPPHDPAHRLHRAAFKHVLTHRDLHLHPVVWTVADAAQPTVPGQWLGIAQWTSLGLPAPVRKLLQEK